MFYYFEAAVFENFYIPALLLGLLYLRIFTASRCSERLPTGMDITRIIYPESDVYQSPFPSWDLSNRCFNPSISPLLSQLDLA